MPATHPLRSPGTARPGWMPRDPGILPFLALLGMYGATALLAQVIAPYDAGAQNLSRIFEPPLSEGHLLGTDNLGRDILSRVIVGTRISMGVGFAAVVLSGTLGTLLGLFSGYLGGAIDDLTNWLVNVQLAFPFVLLAISVVVVLGPSLQNMILVLTIAGWPVYLRVVRSKVLLLRETEYVEAAIACGARRGRVIFTHILPNLLSSLIVLATIEVARMVIAEAALSFLGLGPADADYSSWGVMLAEGKNYMTVGWWLAVIPGLAIMTLVLTVNIVGDWLRDRLDPRLRTD